MSHGYFAVRTGDKLYHKEAIGSLLVEQIT